MVRFAGFESGWNWKAFDILMIFLFLLPCLYLVVSGGKSPTCREEDDRHTLPSTSSIKDVYIEDLIEDDGRDLSLEDLWIEDEKLIFLLSTELEQERVEPGPRPFPAPINSRFDTSQTGLLIFPKRSPVHAPRPGRSTTLEGDLERE